MYYESNICVTDDDSKIDFEGLEGDNETEGKIFNTFLRCFLKYFHLLQMMITSPVLTNFSFLEWSSFH